MNLWADLDKHDQQLLDAVGRSQRVRRPTEHAIFSDLRDWLLQEYVSSYCRSLAATRIFRRCYWIDALGLPSKAKTNLAVVGLEQEANVRVGKEGKKKGMLSPIPLALRPIAALSQALAQESRPITLYGLLLEAGSSRRRTERTDLKSALEPLPKESALLRASWLEIAPLLLKEIEPSPAIFLLNPFSLTLFSYDDLAPLYQRAVPTELCLLIPHKQLEVRLLKAQDTPAQANALTALLRSDRWRSLPGKAGDMALALDGFIDQLVASMKRFFPQAQRIPLYAQTGPALVTQLPYTLIFATRRQDSLICMNDAVYNYRCLIRTRSRRGLLSEEWFAQQEREHTQEQLQQLYHDILQQGRALRIRRWPDLRYTLLLARFGQFALYQYDLTIQKLLLDGEVRCQWRQPSSEEKRVPGGDDTLIWR